MHEYCSWKGMGEFSSKSSTTIILISQKKSTQTFISDYLLKIVLYVMFEIINSMVEWER